MVKLLTNSLAVREMQSVEEYRAWLSKIMDMLEEHFGKEVEVVLHDLSLPYDHTIIDIRNGWVTGRAVGDGGDNLGLEVIRGTVTDGSKFNYINTTDDGRVLRSSTLFLNNEEGRAVAAFAINEDITKLYELEKYLKERNHIEREPDVIIRDVNKLLDSLIEEIRLQIGKSFSAMNKDDKMQVIEFLDKRGAFLITKSGQKVCEILGISKFTLYNYLDAVRERDADVPEPIS